MSDLPAGSTRDSILDAAERLFAELGHEAASMRRITTEARVNLAAVNYHFGSKEALISAVLKRRLEWLNQERLRVLEALEHQAAGAPLKPSQIVDAFFGTLVRHAVRPSRGGKAFLPLLERAMTDPSNFIRTLFAEEYAGVLDRYKQALFAALPDVPREEIVWRFHFMLGATSYALVGTDVLKVMMHWQDAPPDGDAADHLVARLMSFLMGGLRAPLPAHASACPMPP